jgi:hypothetical protein
LLERIADHVEGKPDDTRIFAAETNGWRMLDSDLSDAGIDRKTPDGIFDFHSLRHECASILAAARIPVKAIQDHMRLGSIELTLDTYGHLFDEDKPVAAEILEKVMQRIAQRNAGQNVPDLLEPPGIGPGLAECDSSDAILLILSIPATLHNKRRKPVAPKVAQRLLRRSFSRALSRSRRGGTA